jgi:hypothetical protein
VRGSSDPIFTFRYLSIKCPALLVLRSRPLSRRVRREVGGGVAYRTIPTVTPISRFPGATLCANFAQTEFCEVG